MEKNIAMLEKELGYTFKNKNLIETALTHSSFSNENRHLKLECNERLEFLGDAVLGMVSAEYLYQFGQELPEGQMTRLRASMVCEQSLAETASKLSLGEYMRFGKGEIHSGGNKRPSIVADATEALIAAIYLDGGFEETAKIIKKFVLKPINVNSVQRDYKTVLQEQVQKKSGQILEYNLLEEHGPEHDKSFVTEVLLNGKSIGVGEGRSKKEAEQNAAKKALEEIQG